MWVVIDVIGRSRPPPQREFSDGGAVEERFLHSAARLAPFSLKEGARKKMLGYFGWITC